MKIFLVVTSFFLYFTTYSQITITSLDMPSVNDTVWYSYALNTSNNPAQTGVNYTWDYSGLVPVNQVLDTFKSVTSTPLLYQFYFNNQILYPDHKANYGVRGNDFTVPGFLTVTNVFDYFKKDADAYKNVGFGATINGFPASVRNIPVDTVYKFPLNIGDIYNSYSESLLSVPNLFTYQQKKWRSAVVEGWGTLITPYGTFQTLKIKFEIDITDSINIDTLGFGFAFPRPTEIQYHWLAQGEDVPLLQISTVSGNITNIQYKDIFRALNVNENLINNTFTIYPNPAKQFLNISFNHSQQLNEQIIIYDIHGYAVFKSTVQPNTANFIIDISSLSNGLYLIQANNSTSRFIKIN